MSLGDRIKTALFVDFDNIYLGLHRVDPEAAEIFATEPTRWLAWMDSGFGGRITGPIGEGPNISILVRKCYLNPKTFHKYRPYFTRSAFEVVDCPPLTSQGKTSSDIRMVMDILDSLQHPTRFDDFVILSGDADFTPVLLRLRAHDRRTHVVAVGYAATAYTAACDRLITEDRFIEEALHLESAGGLALRERGSLLPPPPSLGVAPFSVNAPPSLPAGVAGEQLLDQMSSAVVVATRAAGGLPAASLPRVYRRFQEFSAASDWLGFKSLRALTEELVRRDARLRIAEDDADNWRVVAIEGPPPSPPHTQQAPITPGVPPVPIIIDGHPIEPSPADLRSEILRVLRAYVSSSPRPVTMASASQEVIRQLGNVVVDSRWAGTGSFKDLLLTATDLGLTVDTQSPGYIFDPEKHDPPEAEDEDWPPPSRDGFWGVIRRIHEITGVPVLRPEEYCALFQTIAEILGKNPFQVTTTSKAVRDALIARDFAVSRQAVTFVLRGIMYGGLPLHEAPKPWGARLLGTAFQKNVLAMCDDAELTLAAEEKAVVEYWLLGPLIEEPTYGAVTLREGSSRGGEQPDPKA